MAQLHTQRCEACTPQTPTLSADEIADLKPQISAHWSVLDGRVLHRDMRFPDFMSAFARAAHIAEVAEQEGHHPDLHISYGRLGIDLTTHTAGGLTRNDFILAAKIDALER